jgi:hypothetical protein
MSKGGSADTERRFMVRSIVLCTIIAVAAFFVVIYLRLTSIQAISFIVHPFLMPLLIVLLVAFYAGVYVSVANLREMGRGVSGWFDVLTLMVVEGILAFLIFGELLYVLVIILLCSAFVFYVRLAQPS